MDFETRDHYRKVVEDLAQASRKGEETIAQEAVWLAEQDRGVLMLDSISWEMGVLNLKIVWITAPPGVYVGSVGF